MSFCPRYGSACENRPSLFFIRFLDDIDILVFLGSLFYVVKVLFARNWVPFLEFLGPLLIGEQCDWSTSPSAVVKYYDAHGAQLINT